MHTGGHGKSKSRKPSPETAKPIESVNTDKNEIESIIEKYSKQNMHQAMIGQLLKEKHNVPYVKNLFGKRLGKILEEKGVKGPVPPDMFDLMKKAVNMREHITANHKDNHNKLRLQRTESKIWKLSKYYKSKGTLAHDWKYDPEQAALLIKGND